MCNPPFTGRIRTTVKKPLLPAGSLVEATSICSRDARTAFGTKRQFAIALQLVRFWGEADINWQRENAASVANDPEPT